MNALRSFEAAARHLSFTQAADELNVTQAAVSHQVKALEDWFGRPLFVRRNRTIELTEAGQAYLPDLRDAFDTMNEATARLLRRDESGILVISVLASFAATWLVPRLGSFADAQPDIDVRISANDANVDFEREEVDLGIRYGRGEWPGLVSERILTESISVVCSPNLLQGANPLKQPSDLARYTMLHDSMREDWRMWLEAANVQVQPRRSLGFSHSSMVLQAAVEGLGVALGRSVLVADHLAAGRLVKPFELSLEAEFAYFLVCPERNLERPKVKAFRDWLMLEADRAAMGGPT